MASRNGVPGRNPSMRPSRLSPAGNLRMRMFSPGSSRHFKIANVLSRVTPAQRENWKRLTLSEKRQALATFDEIMNNILSALSEEERDEVHKELLLLKRRVVRKLARLKVPQKRRKKEILDETKHREGELLANNDGILKLGRSVNDQYRHWHDEKLKYDRVKRRWDNLKLNEAMLHPLIENTPETNDKPNVLLKIVDENRKKK